ncbi:MAG: hypothetical protein JNK05_30650 [Myxococcales bacterium]|nr:hypothetical protein [Myxococcales bacterium]
MSVPGGSFVALYGSNSGDWRERVAAKLDDAGVAWFSPMDPRWSSINADNGDEMQSLVDALVEREHAALERATCVLFHLGRYVFRDNTITGHTTMALASRAELGFLAGRGIETVVHVEPDVEGRNYLWAVANRYSHMTRVTTLDAAVARVIERMRAK